MTQQRGGPRRSQRHRWDSRRQRCCDPLRCGFQHYAAVGRHSKALQTQQKHVRRWLAVADVVACDHRVKVRGDLVDAMFIKCRDDDRVVMRAALVVTGVRNDGYREILGIKIGNTESFATWDETFRWLKSRGLNGVAYVISDQHGGLTEAITKHFHDATWQRCQVHLMRNILGSCQTKHRADVASAAKLVFQAADITEARRRLAEFSERFGKSAAKSVACLEAGFEDAMAVMSLPEKYRKRLRTTNMQERLNEEIRRRERVIRIFPNDDSALRLIGALLAEQNEVWQERRYLDMGEYAEWVALRVAAREGNNVVALSG